MIHTRDAQEAYERIETAFRCRKRAGDLRIIAGMLESTHARRVLIVTAEEYEGMARVLDRSDRLPTMH